MPKGTLFNYFKVTPSKSTPSPKSKPVVVKEEKNLDCKPFGRELNVSNTKKEEDEEMGEDLPTVSPSAKKAKKRKRIIESDDSDEDYNPDAGMKTEKPDNYDSDADIENTSPPSQAAKRKCLTPKTHRNQDRGSFSPFSKPAVSSPLVKQKLSSYQADTYTAPKMENQQKFDHEMLDFLAPQNIMDGNRRRPDHEQYDKTTLHIPSEFIRKLTPAMSQWWQIKSKNFDVILFFKVGKFYELYHMDAVVGVVNLGLIYMKGNYAHCGFPEISFGRYSDALVQKGFCVARVEQTETPEQNRIRIKGRNVSKSDKTLRREICRVMTKGTQLNSFWDGGSDHYEHNYLMAVKEKSLSSGDSGTPHACREFGVCFVDTSVSVFHVGQFEDDACCSKLCTLFAHVPPTQILYERSSVSSDFKKILQAGLASVMQNPLIAGSQFWDATKTLQVLSKGKYFVKNEEECWPELLRSMMEHGDVLQLLPAAGYELALSALGACSFYLKKCLIDFQTLSIGQFKEYRSIHDVEGKGKKSALASHGMVMDSVCLSNLEVFVNSKGGREGTLLECLDSCKTAFGKRLLRQWVSIPSCSQNVINDRLDAIEDLFSNDEIVGQLSKLLSKMPDMERMLYRVHSEAKGSVQSDHPENRAILYEEHKYSKKKIEDFINLLQQYENYFDYLKTIKSSVGEFRSKLLKKILGIQGVCETGEFPNLDEKLQHWKKTFDRKKAQETGKIIPHPGTNPEYDQAVKEMKRIGVELDEYLGAQQRALKCSQLQYKGSGNKRFQMEMPESHARSLPIGYVICGQRKGFKSFRTDETESFLKRMEAEETRRDSAQAETMSIIFYEFVKDWQLWTRAVNFLSVIDVIMSFACFSKGKKGAMCRPVVVQNDDEDNNGQPKRFLNIVGSRHPCVTKTFLTDDFIPNDVTLGTDGENQLQPSCMLLTGPNMGGKSTLMRQVGLLTVLAQIGCYVPAERCELTPCDRIFTRLGASDKIMSGESTFFVELNETSTILKHATQDSLVLLDELGRGTATYDGTAIAYAVLSHVSEVTCCRTIFSTHYHTLVEDFMRNADVTLAHMAILVEDQEEEEGDEMLTFLYKLRDGPCPKSYGFHAASLAGIPQSVVSLSKLKASELERNNNDLVNFRKLWLS